MMIAIALDVLLGQQSEMFHRVKTKKEILRVAGNREDAGLAKMDETMIMMDFSHHSNDCTGTGTNAWKVH